MPRRNLPRNQQPIFHAGMMAYLIGRRKERAELRKREELKARHNAELERRAIARRESRQRRVNFITRVLDKIEKYPSKLAVQRLREYATDRSTPPACRARAAEILLRWTDGNFNGKRRRDQSDRG